MSWAPRAEQYEPLPEHHLERWSSFGRWQGQIYFPALIGLEVEELRADYARLRLPWRTEVTQPMGMMHGGAIATMIDTAVVPAVGTAYEEPKGFITLSMNINYLGAIRDEDAIVEGWVDRRGRSIVYCSAEVASASGVIAATGTMVYKLTAPRGAIE